MSSYNHTCEGSEPGLTLSWARLGNGATTGCCGQRPTHQSTPAAATPSTSSHPAVIRMVVDSLRYWVQEFHVDGPALRPRRHARARGARLRPWLRLLRCAAAGPAARPRQLISRTLGHQPRRLPDHKAPGRHGRVERALPRRRALLLAQRRRPAQCWPRTVGSAEPLTTTGASPGERELHHRP